jgi:hypothetical protein
MVLRPSVTGTRRRMDESEKPPRPRPDLDRVREAMGEAGERAPSRGTPRPDDPEHQREARDRLADDDEESVD